MTDDLKKRVQQAIENHHKKLLPKQKRKHTHPERDITQPDILAWCRSRNWSIDVVESRAVFNEKSGGYHQQQAKSGFSDLVGNMIDGRAVFIELKAPGKRTNASAAQVQFLTQKINTNCFACVTDGSKHLAQLFARWLNAPDKKSVLLDDLPQKFNSSDGSNDPTSELPF